MNTEAIKSAYEAGEAYANGLKVGDQFRGSHGEATYRGLEGLERKVFGLAALEVIEGMGIWTDEAGVIVRLERR